MIRSLNELYEEYVIKHNGTPKHDLGHFMGIMSKIIHHKTYIKPKIKWWYEHSNL